MSTSEIDYPLPFHVKAPITVRYIPSKAESLRGVSCLGRGGVSAGVDVLVSRSLDTDDLDVFRGTAYTSAGGGVL